MEKESLVIIGNGMAPGRMLEYLFELAPDRYSVTIFNAEPRVNYNRLMLSPVLSGEKCYEDIITHDDNWYREHDVTLHRSAPITSIDREAKRVTSANGITAHYNKLVIATGSSPFVLPLPGKDLDGVLTYRDLDDVENMIQAARAGGHAVVIGGGLLGLEAAAGLKAQGMGVTVVHLMDTLMERQLDASAGHLLEQAFADRGVEVLTGAQTEAILGEQGRVSGVQLKDGRQIDASMVVMAVGIRPSAQLAEQCGLQVKRGIVVDDTMHTDDADIFALGECVEHRGECYGLVAPLYDMAKVIAEQLTDGSGQYTGSETATKLKVTGVDLYSAGDFADGADREEIVLRDAGAGIYKRLVLSDNRIIGAVLYGDTADGPWFFDLLQKKTDVSELRDSHRFYS